MSTVQVLSPDEMVKHWQQALPDAVVETFNELLAKQFNGKTAKILEEDLLSAIKKKGLAIHEVREQNWLSQTRELYTEKGWKVSFNSPGWDDNFKSYFYFEIK